MKLMISLTLCYFMILLMGRFVGRANYLSYIFVGLITLLQLIIMLFFIFTLEAPDPEEADVFVH